jgi:poly(3-hydroxybutyrate) depolymerase
MARIILLVFVSVVALPAWSAAADKILKESFGSGGRMRTYYLYVPDGLTDASPAPLLIVLHGSGRNGLSLVERWRGLAKKEKLVVVGPDAVEPAHWSLGVDGPDFMSNLVDLIAGQYPVNRRRVYLFGHSAGGGMTLMLAPLESQYFAAAAAHAGGLFPENYRMVERADRKIPIAVWSGTADRTVPIEFVRATRDGFKARGLPLELTEIKGHTHWYYDRANEINQHVWEFLKKHELAEDPVFTKYEFGR